MSGSGTTMEELRLKQEEMLQAQKRRGGKAPGASAIRATVKLRDADAAIAAAIKAVADYVESFDRMLKENGLDAVSGAEVRELTGDAANALGRGGWAMAMAHIASMETCLWNKIDVPVPGTWTDAIPEHLRREGCDG